MPFITVNIKMEVIDMFEKVKEIIARELMVEEDEVTMEANIKDDLGADSLAVVDLAMALEDEFEVEIPDEDLENIKTVGDIVEYLKEKAE